MDKDLTVNRAQAGDETALAEIFNEFHNKVYYFAVNHVKSAQDAEDVVQNTFIEVFKSIGSLQDAKALQSWIFTIAHRQVVAYYRKNEKLPQSDGQDVSEATDITDDDSEFLPGNVLENDELKSAVMEIILSLPQSQKTAILLYYYEEMGLKEIAQIEDCSEGTIKSRLNYARKYIKAKVEERRKKGDYAVAVFPLPLITMLLREMAAQHTMQTEIAQGILSNVCASAGIDGAGMVVSAIETVSASTSATATTASATATTVSATGLSVLAKCIIGLCVAGVAAGGVFMATLLLDGDYVYEELHVAVQPVTTPVATPIPSPEPTPVAEQQAEYPNPFPGFGTEESPFLLSEPEHLVWINSHWRTEQSLREGHYLMVSDIVAPRNWNYDVHTPFDGVFDGGEFTLYVDIDREGEFDAVNARSASAVGLFGLADHQSIIRNLTIAGSINSEFFSHGVVRTNRGRIENVHVSATISGGGGQSERPGTSSSGGIVGGNEGAIYNSHTTGNILNRDGSAGGIAVGNTGVIENTTSSGNISNGGSERSVSVGGIVGTNGGQNAPYSVVRNSHSFGNITGGDGIGGVGGVAGSNQRDSIIENSTSSGNIHGISIVGGVVGRNLPNGIVVGSYATGNVTGNENVGQLIGYYTTTGGPVH